MSKLGRFKKKALYVPPAAIGKWAGSTQGPWKVPKPLHGEGER